MPTAQECFSQGFELYKQCRYQEAIKAYDKAIELKSDDPNVYFGKGTVLLALSNHPEAIAAFSKAIELKPDFAFAYYNKGLALSNLGEYLEAIDFYNKAIELKPDFAFAHRSKEDALKALDKNPEEIERDPDDAAAYFNKGVALRALGKNLEAMEAYDEAIERDPDYADAYCAKGVVLSDLDRNLEAIVAFSKAIELKPYYTNAYCNKGIALSALDRNLEAIEVYDKAIELRSDYAVAYYNKGIALSDLGRNLEAIVAYDEAIALNPDYADAYFGKGVALRALGKNLEAIKAYDKAIERDPDYADAYFSKGIALKDLDRNLEAIKAYDKAISIRPEALYYCAKGKILNEIGREQEALACFNKAFQMSKEGKVQAGKDNLSKGNVEYINKALSEDRGALIEKLSKLQSLSNDVKSTIDALGCVDDAKEEIIEEFTRLKRAQTIVMGEIIDGFGKDSKKTDDKESSRHLDALQKEFAALKVSIAQLKQEQMQTKAQVDSHASVLQDSGAYEKAEIKRGFASLDKDSELSAYCKTFYWTMVNLIAAYRVLSTGLVATNLKNSETTEDKLKGGLVVAGVKKAASLAAEVAKGIPFVGSIVVVLDKIIDSIYEAVKEHRSENKVNAINKVIQAKFGTEDDISSCIGKLALVVTKAKQEDILYPDAPSSPTSTSISASTWFKTKFAHIKDKVMPSIELHDRNSHGAQLALQDVVLLIAYMCKNSASIVQRADSLDKQCQIIVTRGGLDTLLSDAHSKTQPKAQLESPYSLPNTTTSGSRPDGSFSQTTNPSSGVHQQQDFHQNSATPYQQMQHEPHQTEATGICPSCCTVM